MISGDSEVTEKLKTFSLGPSSSLDTGYTVDRSVLGFDHTTRGFAQVRTDHWANQRRRGSREIKNCLFSTSGTANGQISKLLFGVLVVPLVGAT